MSNKRSLRAAVIQRPVGGGGGCSSSRSMMRRVELDASLSSVQRLRSRWAGDGVLQCEMAFHIEKRLHFYYNAERVGKPLMAGGGPGNRGSWQSGAASCYDFPGALAQDRQPSHPQRRGQPPSCKCPGVSVAYAVLFRAGPAEGHNRNPSSSTSIGGWEYER